MYVDKKRKRWPGPVLALAVILTVVCVCRYAFPVSGRDMDEESTRAVKAAVERCALQCYVVEGVYPPELSYMEEHYGLQVNHDDYYVTYEVFASNLPPEVAVVSKP